MKICQDMDGVILDLISIFVKKYNEKYNENRTIKEITTWEFYKDWGMTRDECFEIFNSIDQRDTKLLDSSIPEKLKWMNEHFEVDIVTLKPADREDIVKKALEMNGIFQGIHYNKLIVLGYEISHVKATLDYDIYIDDNEKLARHFQEVGYSDKLLLLYDSYWNRSIGDSKNVFRVNNWREIMDDLRMILMFDEEEEHIC